MQNIWLLEKTSKLNSLIQTQVHAKKELLYMYSMFKLSIQNNSFTTEYNIRISFIHYNQLKSWQDESSRVTPDLDHDFIMKIKMHEDTTCGQQTM